MNRPLDDISMPALLVAAAVIAATFAPNEAHLTALQASEPVARACPSDATTTTTIDGQPLATEGCPR